MNGTIRRTGLALVALACALPASAGSEPAKEDSLESIRIHSTEDGRRYEIVIIGDRASAKVDGMTLAPDHIRRESNRVVLLDDEGNEIRSFVIPSSPGTRPGVMVLAPEAPGVPGWAPAAHAERPPVMLGIILGSPGEAMRAQLGVSEYAIVVERVTEGLPAAKAGLQRYDIITGIAGQTVDRPGMLHEVLMKSEPGQRLELEIIRHARTMTVPVELAPYDETIIAPPTPPGTPRAPGAPVMRWNWSGDESLNLDAAREALEAARKRLGERAQGIDAESVTREIERAMREIEIGARDRARAVQQWYFDGQGRLLQAEAERQIARGEQGDRFAALEEQLARKIATLEQRWQSLEARFESLMERLESSLDRRRQNEDEPR
jgi:hypothetical protein